MPFTLQVLHSSDFEAGIDAIDDAVRYSAVINQLKTNTTGTFGVSSTVLANTLTLSSGDNYIPGIFLNASSDPSLNGVGGLGTSSAPVIGRADIAILNALGIQASAFGNHEFDLGPRQVRDILRNASGNPGTNFPYLSSNLDFTTEPDLASELAVNQTTAEASAIARKIAKSTIITLPGNDGVLGTADDQKIGIVGATTPTLRSISSPGGTTVKPANATDYAALAAEIQTTVDALTATGINKIVLLSHMQQIAIERDELAPRLRNVDIILAGGSNTLLSDANDPLRAGDTSQGAYPTVKTSASGQPVLVVNTDGNYRYVGRLVAEFDDNGVINTNSLNNTINGAYATDEAGVDRVYGSDVNPRDRANPNIVAITDALRNVVVSKDSNFFGNTTVFLNGNRNDVRTQETNFGNLTADANLALGKQIDPTVVISIKNGGGIRDNIGEVSAADGATDPNAIQKLPPQPNPLIPNDVAGRVSQLDIENSLRFNNGLSLVTVTVAQLKEVLENAVAGVAPGATPGAFPQVSGIAFSFDVTKPAQVLATDGTVTTPGQRIQSLAVTDENGNFKDILVRNGAIAGDPNRAFRLITLDFLAGTTQTAGGDNYPFFRFIRENPTLANRIDLARSEDANSNGVLDAGEDLNRNGRLDGPALSPTGPGGGATFAKPGTEQDALAEYLKTLGTFAKADVGATGDRRIQNISARKDGVFNVVLSGDNRANRLRGNFGDDTLSGLSGSDRIVALDGNDVLLGGSGNDTCFGGNGNDTIISGIGTNDRSIGGLGRDVFVLGKGPGRNAILDFKNNQDKLALTDGLKFSNLRFSRQGNDTVVRFRNDVLAVLKGVNPSVINSRDFVSTFSTGELG